VRCGRAISTVSGRRGLIIILRVGWCIGSVTGLARLCYLILRPLTLFKIMPCPPKTVCVQFEGIRLLGQSIGVFTSPPLDCYKRDRWHGINDMCAKKYYPPPTASLPLVQDSVELFRSPFVPELPRLEDYRVVWPDEHYTIAEIAWSRMIAKRAVRTVYPDQLPHNLGWFGSLIKMFNLYFFAELMQQGGSWQFPLDLIDPAWVADDSVFFQVDISWECLVPPPALLTLDINDDVVLMSDCFHRFFPRKTAFMRDGNIVRVFTGPDKCTFFEFFAIPPEGQPESFDYRYQNSVECSPVLTVRRKVGNPYVCIPGDLLQKALYIGLIEPQNKLFIGPALPVSCLAKPV
jgi:hypothetical protein